MDDQTRFAAGAPQAIAGPLPRHVAIIMDGNGRWARQRGLSRAEGHRQGVRALKPIVKEARRTGIAVLTVFAFSTENWRRPPEEVDALMALLVEFLRSETAELKAEGVKIQTIGNVSALPVSCQEAIHEAVRETRQQKRMILNLALNYGARDEIVRAVNQWLDHHHPETGDRLTREELEEYLDTKGLPDPDLLIRSSGELRLSNFLLWQSAYTEFYITETLWPDFRPDEFRQALEEYRHRQRRFGRLG